MKHVDLTCLFAFLLAAAPPPPPPFTERSASPPAAATDIDAHAAKRRIAAVVRAQVAAQREGCTFAPATNARSRELVEKSALFKQVRVGGLFVSE